MTYTVDLQIASSGWDRESFWGQARCGVVPGAGENGQPLGVITVQKVWLNASDSFFDLHSLTSTDGGVTWSTPQPQANVTRHMTDLGLERVAGDLEPSWHAATQTLLATGQDVYYAENHKIPKERPRHCTYTAFDVESKTWGPLKDIDLPQPKFYNAGAGSCQRYDLDDGRILLPIYFRTPEKRYAVTVLLCEFDGSELRCVEQGNELTSDENRGFAEPSVIECAGRFFMTIRHDKAGWVAASDDGLYYSDPIKWTFDDGSDLGNYNTQQHWVRHNDELYMVYTRRGLNNDHVFRHRGPLVMARIDTEKLCVIRETEQIIVPERGARMGNFSIEHVSPTETWVCVAEWMQTTAPDPYDYTKCEAHGSDNTIWVARIAWAD